MKTRTYLAAALAASLTLAACGSDEEADTPGTSGASETATSSVAATDTTTPAEIATSSAPAAESSAPAGGDGDLVVGYTPLNDLTNEYQVAFKDGMEDAINAAGGEMSMCLPGGDASKQIDCVQSFITQDVDGIVVYAIDAAAMTAGVEAANAAGIPIFGFVTEIPAVAGLDVTFSVNVSDFAAGANAGQAMVDALIEKNGEPRGTVLEVQGGMTSSAAQNRGGGFHSVVDEYPEIEVTSKDANWDTSAATTIIQDWMTANPDTDGIYFHSEGGYYPAAETALIALDMFKRVGEEGHVILTGQDGTNLGVHAVKCGYMDVTGDFALADIGPLTGELVMEYLTNGAVPAVGDTIERPDTLWQTATVESKDNVLGPVVVVPVVPVTAENADDPQLFANKYQGEPNGLTDCEE